MRLILVYSRLWMWITLLQLGQRCSTSLQESTQNGIQEHGQHLEREKGFSVCIHLYSVCVFERKNDVCHMSAYGVCLYNSHEAAEDSKDEPGDQSRGVCGLCQNRDLTVGTHHLAGYVS
jgi:hypothetical protein